MSQCLGPGYWPFDKIFRFEIPGILCEEWNIITLLSVGLSHLSQVIMFQISCENAT